MHTESFMDSWRRPAPKSAFLSVGPAEKRGTTDLSFTPAPFLARGA